MLIMPKGVDGPSAAESANGVVPWTSGAAVKIASLIGGPYCVYDWMLGPDPMGAAAIPGYELTPFLASMFRNQAIVQLCLSLLGFFRSDDALVQFAYVLALVLTGVNYVYDYFVIGTDLTTVYIFVVLVLLIALPRVPRRQSRV